MYRLEIFEQELKATAQGRKILDVITQHMEELIQLINHNREVLVTWKKNKGPLFFSQMMGSGFNTDIVIKKEIEGIKLSSLVRRMAVVLQDHGSPPLALAIDEYLLIVLEYCCTCNSLQEIFKKIRQHEEVKRRTVD
jgi:hypothetical protein